MIPVLRPHPEDDARWAAFAEAHPEYGVVLGEEGWLWRVIGPVYADPWGAWLAWRAAWQEESRCILTD